MTNAAQRILVVDDEPVIRLFLQELFEDEGYEVVTAQSIAEGLAAIEKGDLNLVVTDKNLPDGTGFEIVHAAKEMTPPCEAMIITGYASLDSAVMALQIGAYDYILKPIEDVDLLLEKARKAIEKQDLWRELGVLRGRLAESERSQAEQRPGPTGEPAPTVAAEESASEGGFLEGLEGGLPQLMKLAELGGLLPMLSHELRQPLAGVKGYVDLLLHKRTLDENVRAKLESVREQVAHMAALIENLTSYSRVSTSMDHLVSLPRPIDMALAIFPVFRSKARYDLTLDVPDGESLPMVRGNANAIQQVLVNLLKNAKDALDECGGGSLELRAWHDEESDSLKVRVADTGGGIDAVTRQRLFQPFFTTKEEGIGTGLGLTICRHVMEEHGGSIEVESPTSAEGGAAFTLTFPAVRQPALVEVS